MKIINLTPHSIDVDLDNGMPFSFPPSGEVARVAVVNTPIAPIDDLPVSTVVYGEVEGLPEPQENHVYIVSMIVAQRANGRADVLAPDSGPTAIRWPSGQIKAVKGFIRY